MVPAASLSGKVLAQEVPFCVYLSGSALSLFRTAVLRLAAKHQGSDQQIQKARTGPESRSCLCVLMGNQETTGRSGLERELGM